jgi:pimeloyl-ACP methyl ester carboxylesterase
MVNFIDTGEGEVVLFLHGWGAPITTYVPIIEFLAQTCRVIAPDLPGFGKTDEPDEPWSTDDYVDFAQKFLKERGVTKCVLIGHSHGGRMILNWLSRPEQPIEITKAVLCAAAGLKPPRGLKYYAKVYSYKAFKRILKPFPTLLEKYRGRVGSADYRTASPVMQATLTRVLSEDYAGSLHKIKQSVLLVWGDMDTATPLKHGLTMERIMPNAGLVTLKGGTHYAILEQLPVFTRVLDVFIKD